MYQLSLLVGYRRNLSRTFIRHDCHRQKVQVKAEEEHFISISAYAFLANLSFFPKFKTISESIVILSSYTVYCSRGDEKTFGWVSIILMSHLSFVQCEQIKFRPKKMLR